MLKVIIADDEPKICRLIERLIDWKEQSMVLIAVTNNGIDTLKAIEDHQPDLVITDIRMPGYDGLDIIRQVREKGWETKFIIISGYSHFEYAQSAIKYGVIDYLLKPIKKTDLHFALNRIKNNITNVDDNFIVDADDSIKDRVLWDKKRAALFYKLIHQMEIELSHITLDDLNTSYGFKFSLGFLRVIAIKFDGLGEGNNSALDFISKKTKQIGQETISPYTNDLEYYFKESTLFLLINYSKDIWKPIRKELKKLLDKLQLNESIFSGLKVTIGISKETNNVSKLPEIYETALWSVEERLTMGTNRLIDWEKIELSSFRETMEYREYIRNLKKYLELFDIQEIAKVLKSLKQRAMAERFISGHEVYGIAREIIHLYLEQLRKSKALKENDKELLQRFNTKVQELYRVSEVFDFLLLELTDFFGKVVESREVDEIEPIKKAKRYIIDNYKSHLTLEEVSRIVGFNPSYFSTIFKKSTGITFLDYLSEVRMNNAKELLRDTNYTIKTICEEVGYYDIKHFTKCFVKYTGLKPNEFRKLYS